MGIFYEIQFNIIILIALLFLLYHGAKKLSDSYDLHKIFIITGVASFLLLILELISALLVTSGDHWHKLYHFIVVLSYALTPLPASMWSVICEKWVKRNIPISRRKKIFLSLPFLVNVVLCITTYKLGTLFVITNPMEFGEGPFYLVPVFITFGYFAYSIIFVLKNKKLLVYEEYLALLMFVIIPVLSTIFVSAFSPLNVFQSAFYESPTIWCSFTLALFFLYIYLQQRQMQTDPLTGVWNRHGLNLLLKECETRRKEDLMIVSIDLDDFKSINDTYGHQEGDEVLKSFSKIMVNTLDRQGSVIRLGGDEFLVLIYEDSEQEIEKIFKKLDRNLEQVQRIMNKPYAIKYSYGYGLYTHQMAIWNFINHTDKLMYENKMKHKQKQV